MAFATRVTDLGDVPNVLSELSGWGLDTDQTSLRWGFAIAKERAYFGGLYGDNRTIGVGSDGSIELLGRMGLPSPHYLGGDTQRDIIERGVNELTGTDEEDILPAGSFRHNYTNAPETAYTLRTNSSDALFGQRIRVSRDRDFVLREVQILGRMGTDNLLDDTTAARISLEVWSVDGSGVPNALLTVFGDGIYGAEIANSVISSSTPSKNVGPYLEDIGYRLLSFRGQYTLTKNTRYYLVIRDSGAYQDTDDYFQVATQRADVVDGTTDIDQATWAGSTDVNVTVTVDWTRPSWIASTSRLVGSYIEFGAAGEPKLAGFIKEVTASTITIYPEVFSSDIAGTDEFRLYGATYNKIGSGSWTYLGTGVDDYMLIVNMFGDGLYKPEVVSGTPTTASGVLELSCVNDIGDPDTTEGDLTEGTARYYRVSFADEAGTLIQLPEVQGRYPSNDARNERHRSPSGRFGNMSDASAVVVPGSGNTAIKISDVNVVVPAEYPVSHAYIWAYEGTDPQNGVYRFIGKMKWNGTVFEPLYDTISSVLLAESIPHWNQFLSFPTLSAATKWKDRIVGIANGSASIVGTSITYENADRIPVYLQVVPGSRRVQVVEEDGAPHSTATLIRCMEHEGMTLHIVGADGVFTLDRIDELDRTVGYLTLPYQGVGSQAAEFEARGANALIVGCANTQVREQWRPTFLIPPGTFDGWLTTCIADERGEMLYVFTYNNTYAVRGVPTSEFVDVVEIFTGNVERISSKFGSIGAYSACVGPNGTIFALSDAAVTIVSTNGVEDISNEDLRDFLQSLSYAEKALATMHYDPARHLLSVIFAPLLGTSRTGKTGIEASEYELILDVRTKQWTLWVGHQPRIICGAQGAEGAGPVTLFQDAQGDVHVRDDKRILDKQGSFLYRSAGDVLTLVGSVLTLDITPQPYLRGQYAVVASGTNKGSVAEISSVSGAAITVGSWSDGAPAVSDRVIIGGIISDWQTGSIRPGKESFGAFRGARVELETDSADTDFTMDFEVYTGGQRNQLPADDSPSVTKEAALDTLQTSKTLSLPVHHFSKRLVVGLKWIQPPEASLNDTDVSNERIRVNTLEVKTSEDALDN